MKYSCIIHTDCSEEEEEEEEDTRCQNRRHKDANTQGVQNRAGHPE